MKNLEKSYIDIASEIKETNEYLNKPEETTKIEDVKISPELKELIEYSNEINNIVGKYDTLFFIEPKGRGGISYDEEFELFLKKIKDYLDEDKDQKITDEEYAEMCPIFTYPEIEKIDEKELEEKKLKLSQLEEEIKKCENKNISSIVSELLEIGNAKIDFHKYLKNGDMKKAFKCSEIIWGYIDDDLCRKAYEIYEQKLEFIKNKGEKSELENILENNDFNAEDIKNYFELAITKAGLADNGYEVVIDDSVTNIRVSTKSPRYDHPVVLIPSDVKVNGMKLFKLIAHEIGRHVTTNIYNKKQGFEETMGKGWNVANEGISKRSETEVVKEILGEEFCDFEITAEPYYILAMEKIRGNKNQVGEYENGWNYVKVFKYIYNLKLKEELYKNGYNNLKEQLKNSDDENEKETLTKKIKELEEEIKKNVLKMAKSICLRTFKGFSPKEGGLYFPKDKIYFEGEINIFELEKVKSVKEFEKYLRLSRVDPKFVPYLIKMNAYVEEKGLQMAKDVAKQIWQDKRWPVDYIKDKEWYQENTQMDRHWAYRKEFMNEDMTDIANQKIEIDLKKEKKEE